MLRRKFLKLSGLSAAIIALPAAGFASLTLKDAAVGTIKNEFHYLKLDPKGIEDFVEDFLVFHYWNGRLKYSLSMGTFYTLGIKADSAENFLNTKMLKTLVENYMLSTDFFSNGMDESKLVKYTGLYSPYLKPCFNPFSHLYYPPKVIS